MDEENILSPGEQEILDTLLFVGMQGEPTLDPALKPFLEQAHFLLSYALSVGAIETVMCSVCKEVAVKMSFDAVCRHMHRTNL
jgi:hypothetical protein